MLKKFNCFTNDVIFIDGIWGTGKSIISPIIGSMEGVEKQKIEHTYEYLCILIFLQKIEVDAVDSLLKTYADLSQYNNLTGREVNLRWKDDSGLQNNPNSFRYIKRLFKEEGDVIIEEINKKNLALHIMSHMIVQVCDPLVNAYGERLKIIEIVRHPVYLIQHCFSYFSRFESDREFTLSVEHNGNKVPWFAESWKKEFVEMSIIERSLKSIIHLYELLFNSMDNLHDKKINILVISFESFVMNTEKELKRLEDFLGRSHSSSIKKILKRQKIPRKFLSSGKGHLSYGWEQNKSSSEKEEYIERLKLIDDKVPDKILKEFNDLINTYNERWPSILNQFHNQFDC